MLSLFAQNLLAQNRPLPVIDMHVHALHANDQGPAPINVGAPFRDLGMHDPANDWVFGEITIQYERISASDSAFDPYLAMAERLDIPVGIHIGCGPPGAPYIGAVNYRAKLHSPLVLEEALFRHPKLRVYAMHAGWPMLDDMLAMLYVHPQLYVDLGGICYMLPEKEFYFYLERLVNAGFGKRILFGSDNMVWPQAIAKGIQIINRAGFLTASQKRDILFNNAARFLRLTEKEINGMH